MRTLAAIAITIFSATALAADSPPPIEFKAWRIGETTYAATKENPQLNCRQYDKPIGDYICFAINETIAGAPARAILLFYGDKLALVSVSFDADEFRRVKRALMEKYGPGKSELSVVQNRVGVSFENETVIWQNPAASMKLTMRDRKVDEARLELTSKDSLAEFKRRAIEANKKNASDL